MSFKTEKQRKKDETEKNYAAGRSVDKDGPGPGSHQIKILSNAPKYTFGSRFDSDIRSKAHLRPKKVDGPGPGDYALKSSIK